MVSFKIKLMYEIILPRGNIRGMYALVFISIHATTIEVTMPEHSLQNEASIELDGFNTTHSALT